jgi:hypothetical protein
MFFFILYMQQVLATARSMASHTCRSLGIIISAGVASQLVTKIGFKPVAIWMR